MFGFLFHIAISEAYYIWQMKQTDYCEESKQADDLHSSQKEECIEKILKMPPPFIVSPRLYIYFKYKNIVYVD
jgi:hypothetical protein